MSARAFFTIQPGVGEIRPVEVAAPGPGQVLVETLYTGISRGTESLVFHGRVPPSEHRRMRAPFQEGELSLPVKYGYANVGRVLAGPDGVRDRAVFCLYPHQTRYVVDYRSVTLVPDTVPAARAVLAANMETAINGLWDATPRIGDRIAIVGGGVVGCAVAYLAARVVGCRVQLVDIDPARALVAENLGVGFASPDSADREADLVIHASGAPAGLELALELAGPEAKVVELSWFGDTPVTLPLGAAFHARRLRIVSSQVGRLPASQQARWDYRRRLQLALSLLADPALDALISGECEFDELPEIMKRVTARTPGDGVLCQRVRYAPDRE